MTTLRRSEDVAAELLARVTAIRLTNGSETDIGVDVMWGRRKVPSETEVPCVQLTEGPDEVLDYQGKTRGATAKLSQLYVLDAFDLCDADNPNAKAHMMLRDLKHAVFNGDRTFGGRALEVRYLGKDIGPRADGVGLVQARIMVEIVFVEDLTTP